MKYDLKDIITFVNIARLKSFTKASNAIGISKGVVTTRINDLEKAVGMTLLARTTREVNLTSDGKNFLNYCNDILKKVENLDDFIDGSREIDGILKIVLPPYFSRNHIVPYLTEFLGKYPKLKLNIFLTENPVNIIEEGFDLQVRIQIPEEESLEVTKLISNKKLVCASKDYIFKYGTPQLPQDLINYNCIIFGENEIWKFKHKVKKNIIEMKNISGNIRCDNGEIIKDLVLSGVGITLKSACDVEKELKSGELITLLQDYEVINETEFYATYPSGRNLSPRIRAFIDFFQEKLSKKI